MILSDQVRDWCGYCGSILDATGEHTKEWRGSLQLSGGKQRRANLYRCHANMKQRCTNPKDHNWRWYGAKGIQVCPDWQKFPAFRKWAMKNGYGPDLVIDRINSHNDYNPENCRWVKGEDNQPRRKLSHDDVRDIRISKMPVSDLARQYDVDYSHILRIQDGSAWRSLA